MESNELDLQQLRDICVTLFDNLIAKNESTVLRLSEDDYWEIKQSDRYDFNGIPSATESSKLSDDWEFLLAILKDGEQATTPMFLHLAPIIRAIGEDK